MRPATITMSLLLAFVLATASAQGVQNMDFSLLLGFATTSGVVVNEPSGPVNVSGSVAFPFQFNWGYQFASTAAGVLFVEVPQTFLIHISGASSVPTVAGFERWTSYLTPGVRYKIPTGTRVSFYGVLGAGFGYFAEQDTMVNGELVADAGISTYHFAADAGGGIDLRISRFLSIRAEFRDFISGKGLGGSAGHTHPTGLFGFAFHF